MKPNRFRLHWGTPKAYSRRIGIGPLDITWGRPWYFSPTPPWALSVYWGDTKGWHLVTKGWRIR